MDIFTNAAASNGLSRTSGKLQQTPEVLYILNIKRNIFISINSIYLYRGILTHQKYAPIDIVKSNLS